MWESGGRLGTAIRSTVLGIALLVFAVRDIHIASVYNHTTDEVVHIVCGIELLERGTWDFDDIHPPAARVAAALPLYAAGVRVSRFGVVGYVAGEETLYDGTRYWPALRASRAVITSVGVLLLAFLYAYSLRTWGALPACIAVVAASTSPGIVAHSALVTTDIAGMLTTLIALWTWDRWLLRGGLGRALWLGAAVALALATKLSAAPFLALSCPAVLACRLALRRGPEGVLPPILTRRRALELAAAASVVLPLIWATYGFRCALVANPARLEAGAASMEIAHPRVAALLRTLAVTPVPLGAFIRGFMKLALASREGLWGYFAGELAQGGWYSYFWVALGLKLPVPCLAAGALSLSMAVARRTSDAARETLVVGAAMFAIMGAATVSRINIGVRHVVVVEALLALVTAGGAAVALGLQGRARALVLGVLIVAVLLSATCSVAAHPDLLGYFNVLAGPHPEYWLADSNIDWGQDLERLGAWFRERGIEEPVHLAFLGVARPERHGLRWRPLVPYVPVEGWVAIGETPARGFSSDGLHEGAYRWVKEYPERGRVGTSYRIYEVRGLPPTPSGGDPAGAR